MKDRVTCILAIAFLLLDAVDLQEASLYSNIDPNCDCGESGEGISTRIVGGFVTIPHIFPWIVAIFYKGSLHCGGTLINDRYVLTAGHCVVWIKEEDLTIGLGKHDLENSFEGLMLPVEKVILHEHFRRDFLRDTNDLSLIRLPRSVEYSKTVRPVCLPNEDSDYTNRRVKVSGWGRVTKNGETSQLLRQATLKVMPWEECKNKSFGSYVTESMMCAYNDDTDACQGDSGGPLMYRKYDGRYEIIGIVSWGIGCAEKGIPGVYVKLTDYLDWIWRHTRDSVYCMN